MFLSATAVPASLAADVLPQVPWAGHRLISLPAAALPSGLRCDSNIILRVEEAALLENGKADPWRMSPASAAAHAPAAPDASAHDAPSSAETSPDAETKSIPKTWMARWRGRKQGRAG